MHVRIVMRAENGRIAAITLILLALLLTGCKEPDPLFIDCEPFEENPDQTAEITVVAGEEFELVLCSKRNRGYRWPEENITNSNPEIVQIVSQEYETRKSPMGGIPGLEHWTLRAMQPGTAVITLEHRQSSGRNTLGVYTYQLTVTVVPETE